MDLGIKPRNWPADVRSSLKLSRDKSNTCRAKSKATTERLRASLMGHLERHPRDGASQRRLSKLA